MKYLALKCGIALHLTILLSLCATADSQGQMKYEGYFYAKALGGYGNIFDRFEVTTPGPYGRPVTAKNKESHGNGLNIDVAIGGTISRSKNVSKYSYVDIFVLHRQLLAQEAFFSFSGGGIQGRFLGAHANIVVGYAHTSVEIPNKRYENNILGYGPMAPLAYGFGIGFNQPVKRRSPLIFIWDTNLLFLRAPHDDLTGYLNYKWFSTSLGFKYYLSRIR